MSDGKDRKSDFDTLMMELFDGEIAKTSTSNSFPDKPKSSQSGTAITPGASASSPQGALKAPGSTSSTTPTAVPTPPSGPTTQRTPRGPNMSQQSTDRADNIETVVIALDEFGNADKLLKVSSTANRVRMARVMLKKSKNDDLASFDDDLIETAVTRLLASSSDGGATAVQTVVPSAPKRPGSKRRTQTYVDIITDADTQGAFNDLDDDPDVWVEKAKNIIAETQRTDESNLDDREVLDALKEVFPDGPGADSDDDEDDESADTDVDDDDSDDATSSKPSIKSRARSAVMRLFGADPEEPPPPADPPSGKSGKKGGGKGKKGKKGKKSKKEAAPGPVKKNFFSIIRIVVVLTIILFFFTILLNKIPKFHRVFLAFAFLMNAFRHAVGWIFVPVLVVAGIVVIIASLRNANKWRRTQKKEGNKPNPFEVSWVFIRLPAVVLIIWYLFFLWAPAHTSDLNSYRNTPTTGKFAMFVYANYPTSDRCYTYKSDPTAPAAQDPSSITTIKVSVDVAYKQCLPLFTWWYTHPTDTANNGVPESVTKTLINTSVPFLCSNEFVTTGLTPGSPAYATMQNNESNCVETHTVR